MINSTEMKNMALDYAVDSFRTLLGIQGRSFGGKTKSYDGISDGYEGLAE